MDERRDIPQRDASGRRTPVEAVAHLLRGADIRLDVQEKAGMSDGQTETCEQIMLAHLAKDGEQPPAAMEPLQGSIRFWVDTPEGPLAIEHNPE